jgi:methionyl-tRNA synthetase
MSRKYITTAIDYPNAAPHMGHVLEKVLADVIARWWRLSGHDVRFQVGTDEHGIKIQQTAQREGVTPEQLVERNVPLFQEMYARLHISADVFIRTTDQKRHWPTVIELWKRLRASGALEKRSYTGLYCSGCERFVTKKDLVDGKCPDHHLAPQEVTEENWFFLLSREQEYLQKLLKETYRIEPSFRANETLTLLDGGLEDVSFSRPISSLSWGIPVPDEEGQTMYVWCDALTNYLSGTGYFGGGCEPVDPSWWSDAEITHVIGKDIARFHALIWPAMLHNAQVRPPDRLLIHGFVTSEGQKMSKSIGNVVDPKDVLEKYSVDALRFFLTSEIPVGNDGDFSWKRFGEIYQSKLGNQLGNLLNRVIVMLAKMGGDIRIEHPERFLWGHNIWEKYTNDMNALDIHSGVQHALLWTNECNAHMNVVAPWSEKDETLRRITLSTFAENLRHIALMLLPFIPTSVQEMSRQLGVPYAEKMLEKDFVITEKMKQWGGCDGWTRVGEPRILFPKVE